MNKKRMKTLLKLMKRAKKENQILDMDFWVDTDAITNDNINGPVPEIIKENFFPGRKDVRYLKEGWCGAAACIAGTAAQSPEFKKEGLRIVISRSAYDESETNPEIVYERKGHAASANTQALRDFFDIPYHQAETMFGSNMNNETREFYLGDAYSNEEINFDHVIQKIEEIISTGHIDC